MTVSDPKSQLKITQVRSTIGNKPKARESVRSLGLKKIHQVVTVPDNPVNRGYLKSARHLLTVEFVKTSDSAEGSDQQ
jgi:large subunit ribosomal protein L30